MQTVVSIPGIHCPSCAALIQDISTEFPTIKRVDVDTDRKIVTLDHDATFNLDAWAAEVATLGDAYKVQKISQ